MCNDIKFMNHILKTTSNPFLYDLFLIQDDGSYKKILPYSTKFACAIKLANDEIAEKNITKEQEKIDIRVGWLAVFNVKM